MSAPIIAFFNNKGGVGKTSLVYHLSWMYADLGLRVLAVDLDPQSNLTAAFLDEEMLEEFWPDGEHSKTIYGAIEPLIRQVGDILEKPYAKEVDEKIFLAIGDLALSHFEDELSMRWSMCMDGKEGAFRVISAFWRVIKRMTEETNVDIILVDLGPNLGAINRAALVATDYLVVPIVPDLFSLQGLKNLGPTVRRWRKEWKARLDNTSANDLALPEGKIVPIGYVVMQHIEKSGHPVKAYERWAGRIPGTYAREVLGEKSEPNLGAIDSNRLGLIKHYRSLMPMAQEAHKPIFHLLPADGAIGSHLKGVREAHENFKLLALEIAKRCDVVMPG